MEDSASASQEIVVAWSREGGRPPRGAKTSLCFVCCTREKRSDEPALDKDMLREYARKLAALMDAHLLDVRTSSIRLAASRLDKLTRTECDLFMLNVVPPSSLIRNTEGFELPSLLVGLEVKWPIRSILLLMRGEATDRATVDWAVRLAQSAGCHVTLLVVLPPGSGHGDRVDGRLADVLARHTVPGRYVRQVLKRLVSSDIDAVLRLRQGALARQVRQEVMDGNYDLVITSAEPPGRLLNGYLDRLIEPLLLWTPAPVLVARYPAKWSEQTSQEEGSE